MDSTMQLLSSFKTKDKMDSLKYAYAFMLCKNLYIKECSFINPRPKQIDSEHVFPQDFFSQVYSENNLPPWGKFKNNQTHLSAPAFSCVGSLDRSDQERIMCVLSDSKIVFCCYGNYEAKAQKIISEILLSYKALE